MSLEEVCRACLRAGQTMSSLLASIVPKLDTPSNSAVGLWKCYSKMLIATEDIFPDKICADCLNEIQQTYSFMLKCEKSAIILKRMKDVEIRLKSSGTSSSLVEYDSLKQIPSENYIYSNIVQIKNENIEWNDRKNEYDKEDTDREQFQVSFYTNLAGQLDQRLQQQTFMGHHDDEKIGNELDHLNYEKGEISNIQHIKEEPELDICTEKIDFDGIEYEDQPSIEIVACPGCHFTCRLIESLRKHILDNHMEGQMCKLCNQEFESNKRLMSHVRSHTGERPFQCKICLKTFQRKDIFNYHLGVHTGERQFKCENCSKTFTRKDILTQHLLEGCHTGERPFKCEVCSKTYTRKDILTRHLRQGCHMGERPFKCEICPKTFQRKSKLEAHLVLHTEDEFKCEKCSKIFTCEDNLTNHSRKGCHTGERQFKCEICLKAFQRKDIFIYHLGVHTGERQFKCESCSKSFTRKDILTQHLLGGCHTGERPFKCECCSKTYTRKDVLTRHLRRGCNLGGKPFTCEICLKIFQRKGTLWTHLRQHTGERPFKCEKCSKTFTWKDKLTTHLRQGCPTRKRLYNCELCEKTFQRKDRLSDHLRQHTGERPFKCESCLSTYRREIDLKKHLRCHMGERPFQCERYPKQFAHYGKTIVEIDRR